MTFLKYLCIIYISQVKAWLEMFLRNHGSLAKDHLKGPWKPFGVRNEQKIPVLEQQSSFSHPHLYDIDSSDTACWSPDGIHSWVADQSCNQMNHSWQNRFQFCREKAQPTEPTQCKCVMYTCECGKLLDMVMAIHDLCVLGTPRQRRSMLSSSYPLKDQSYDFMHAGSCAAKQVAQRRPCSML